MSERNQKKATTTADESRTVQGGVFIHLINIKAKKKKKLFDLWQKLRTTYWVAIL